MPMDWGVPAVPIGLTAGIPRLDAQALAERLGLPADPERCVLISFGGLGLDFDPAVLDRWPEHVFVGPSQDLAEAPNGRLLPAGVRPLELMPRCGRIITKPGYSTFCEALVQGVGIHLVHREGFAEAAVLEAALRRHGHHRLLSQAQWAAGDWQLDQPLLPPAQGSLPSDGADQAAGAIEQLLKAIGSRF
jgi:hypothetical protein